MAENTPSNLPKQFVYPMGDGLRTFSLTHWSDFRYFTEIMNYEYKSISLTPDGIRVKGDDITEINSTSKWAIILGSEAHGISDNFKKFNKIRIKQFGSIESLNVSVACGIILNQFIKI